MAGDGWSVDLSSFHELRTIVYGCLMLQLLVTVGRLRWTCQRRWGRDFTVKPCESLSSRRQGSQRQEDTSGPSRRRTFQYISILFNTFQYCKYISYFLNSFAEREQQVKSHTAYPATFRQQLFHVETCTGHGDRNRQHRGAARQEGWSSGLFFY